MYVTRPLSQLLRSPESLTEPPPGPNTGFLVIQDEESETYSCFGCCKNRYLNDLPFPQNKELTVRYDTGSSQNKSSSTSLNPVFLIPVLNLPLSSNRYYAIKPHGKRKGEAFTCSTEEGKITCCFCRCVKDVKPRPLDPNNIYQQFEILPRETFCTPGGYFFAKSLAADGFPPYFLRRKGWQIYTKTPKHFNLDTAQGLDSELRARLPPFGDLDISRNSSQPVIVGKWYCPFIFVKENGTTGDQVEISMYYEMTLEQRWDQVFSRHKNTNDNRGNTVVIDASVETEEAFVGGVNASWNEGNVVGGVIWFTGYKSGGGEMRVGLRVEVLERMKWEQKRGGWKGGEGRQAKIDRVEEFKGRGDLWSVCGCYVLVERFNLRRMDGSLVMCYDFKHCHQTKTIWA